MRTYIVHRVTNRAVHQRFTIFNPFHPSRNIFPRSPTRPQLMAVRPARGRRKSRGTRKTVRRRDPRDVLLSRDDFVLLLVRFRAVLVRQTRRVPYAGRNFTAHRRARIFVVITLTRFERWRRRMKCIAQTSLAFPAWKSSSYSILVTKCSGEWWRDIDPCLAPRKYDPCRGYTTAVAARLRRLMFRRTIITDPYFDCRLRSADPDDSSDGVQ